MAWDVFALEWLARAAAGGFILLLAAAVAVRCCRQPADRVRIIGLALPGALLVPWVALIPGLPRWDLTVLPAESVARAPVSTPELPPVSSAPAPMFRQAAVTVAPTEVGTTGTTDRSMPSAALSNEGSETGSTGSVSQLPSPQEPAPAHETAPAWTAARVVVCGYALLSGLALAWVSVGLWRLYLLWRSARPAPTDLVALLREIGGPAADGVQLLVSPRLDSPVAFGGWRPIILLPESALTPEGCGAIRYGLAHEWSHVERGDVWRWYLVTLAQLFLFYQPLFWWLRRQLRLGQDFLADARATDQTADPIEYAQYLVTLARWRMGVPGLVLGITDRRSNLTRRVHMLLLNRTPLARRCRLAWTCGAALLAVGLVTSTAAVRLASAGPALTAEPRDEKKADEKKPATPEKGETLNYSGVVKDKDTGKPLAGATVTVRRSILGDPTRSDINPVLEETKHTTNAEGKYSFTILPEQTAERYLYIELDVEHPDHAPQKGFGYALSMIRKNEKLGGRPFFESVELRPAKPVTGVVKTPDGQPAAGVKVMAYSVTSKKPQGSFEYGSFADTRTDADGQFCLSLVSPGWAVVWVLPEKFVPTTHVVKDKRGRLGTFTLQAGPRLRGTLLDAKGKPLAGVIVNADSRERNEDITEPVSDNIRRSAVTNEKGEFEMNPLPPGNYLVKPGTHAEDGSIDRNALKPRPVPGVFVGTKVLLKAGAEPEKLEVRAVPHVAIEAQYVDSKGKPTRGHSAHVFGQFDGVFWFGEAKITPDGKMVALVPHGLEQVQFNMTTNEHGTLRWRKTKDGPLNNSRQMMLGTLTDDVKGIEIVRYTAPILLVKVTTKDGSKPTDLGVTAVYPQGKGQRDGRFIVTGGRTSDVSFEQQEDSRFRSSQLLPDEEVTVTGHAKGYAEASQKVKLEEGTTKEIEIVLEKAAEKDGEKK